MVTIHSAVTLHLMGMLIKGFEFPMFGGFIRTERREQARPLLCFVVPCETVILIIIHTIVWSGIIWYRLLRAGSEVAIVVVSNHHHV